MMKPRTILSNLRLQSILMFVLTACVAVMTAASAGAQDAPPDISCVDPPADRIQPKNDTVRVAGLTPLNPQPDKDSLTPGLAVRYFYKKTRSLKTIPSESSVEKGKAGPPILIIDHQFGRDEVFDSGVNRLVMLRMKGMLHLPEAGTYGFRALSNDGVRVHLGGQLILSDPRWHSDRCSHPAEVRIDQPGWYAFTLEYFQRKGTAALRLYWQPPGTEQLSIVPAEAYAH